MVRPFVELLTTRLAAASEVALTGDAAGVVATALAAAGHRVSTRPSPVAVAVGRITAQEWRALDALCAAGGEAVGLAFPPGCPHEALAASIARETGLPAPPATAPPPRGAETERVTNVLRFDSAGHVARALLGGAADIGDPRWAAAFAATDQLLGPAVRPDGTVVLPTWAELVRVRR